MHSHQATGAPATPDVVVMTEVPSGATSTNWSGGMR
jgi:hypothetical protein